MLRNLTRSTPNRKRTRNRRKKQDVNYPARRIRVGNMEITPYFDLERLEIVPIVPDVESEPMYNCCKGCPNWKGANTVCNCTLPFFEMMEGTGDYTITVSKNTNSL